MCLPTPAPHRTPALPAGHRDGVAGGARGRGEDTPAQDRTPALPAGHRDGVAGGARGCWVFDRPGWCEESGTSPGCSRMRENGGRRLGRRAAARTERGTGAHRAAHLHRTSRKNTGTVCGAPHTCPPGRTHLPRAQVLGRDGVARSASAVPGGAGVAKLEAPMRRSPPHSMLTESAPVKEPICGEPLQTVAISLACDGRGEEA